MSWSTSELRVRLAPLNRFKPSSKIFYWPFKGGTSFLDLFMFLFCLVFAMSLCASVYMCFVVTCWERADLLALVCGVLLWVCHFPIGILGQVWYLIVSIPDICTLTYSVPCVKWSTSNMLCYSLNREIWKFTNPFCGGKTAQIADKGEIFFNCIFGNFREDFIFAKLRENKTLGKWQNHSFVYWYR